MLTKAPLDHEDDDTYTVTVKVVDPSAASATITVTITVNNIDEPPVLSGPDVVDYPENGTDAVEQYTAEDPEGVTIRWSVEGADSSHFEINSSTGVLRFKSSPDHDAPADADSNNVYLVVVKATAGTTSASMVVKVTVSNVNEAPEFPASEDGSEPWQRTPRRTRT